MPGARALRPFVAGARQHEERFVRTMGWPISAGSRFPARDIDREQVLPPFQQNARGAGDSAIELMEV